MFHCILPCPFFNISQIIFFIARTCTCWAAGHPGIDLLIFSLYNDQILLLLGHLGTSFILFSLNSIIFSIIQDTVESYSFELTGPWNVKKHKFRVTLDGSLIASSLTSYPATWVHFSRLANIVVCVSSTGHNMRTSVAIHVLYSFKMQDCSSFVCSGNWPQIKRVML